MEQMALNYFYNLPKIKKIKIMKKIVNLLKDSEKVELAKIILKK